MITKILNKTDTILDYIIIIFLFLLNLHELVESFSFGVELGAFSWFLAGAKFMSKIREYRQDRLLDDLQEYIQSNNNHADLQKIFQIEVDE